MKPETLSLKQRAYKNIFDQIMDGRFAPGTLLNRRGLAQQLKMSAAPVHEAMIQLEQNGFLEALPRHGTRVLSVQLKDVRGHLVIREALECQAARMICGERLKHNLPALKILADAIDLGDQTDAVRARQEVSFHVALVELADCPALLREYRKIMQMGLFYRINLLMSLPSRELKNRHTSLLEGLCTDSPEAAEHCMREHVCSGKPEALKS